ncbi:hypothetical protein ACFX2J_023717 [Malus domestica]
MEFWKLLLASGSFLASWVLAVGGQNLPPCSFPAIYNFGDSDSDIGGISATFESIKPHNGEAFFHKPAGRAADGRLVIDFIGYFYWLVSVLIEFVSTMPSRVRVSSPTIRILLATPPTCESVKLAVVGVTGAVFDWMKNTKDTQQGIKDREEPKMFPDFLFQLELRPATNFNFLLAWFQCSVFAER